MTSRIFCAIDTADFDLARGLARTLKGHVAGLKLGLEFFNAHGPQGYKIIADQGTPLFLDLKLHDIPNTVAGAVTSLLRLKPNFLTIHASGGAAMMKAARQAAENSGAQRPQLLGVTVLTSMNETDLDSVGVTDAPDKQVMRLATLAKESGLDGVICAPTEVKALRQALGADFILMVPGIRPSGAALGDQKRVLSPKDAVDAGASYIVIGRPITQVPDPLGMVRAINAQCGE